MTEPRAAVLDGPAPLLIDVIRYVALDLQEACHKKHSWYHFEGPRRSCVKPFCVIILALALVLLETQGASLIRMALPLECVCVCVCVCVCGDVCVSVCLRVSSVNPLGRYRVQSNQP